MWSFEGSFLPLFWINHLIFVSLFKFQEEEDLVIAHRRQVEETISIVREVSVSHCNSVVKMFLLNIVIKKKRIISSVGPCIVLQNSFFNANFCIISASLVLVIGMLPQFLDVCYLCPVML